MKQDPRIKFIIYGLIGFTVFSVADIGLSLVLPERISEIIFMFKFIMIFFVMPVVVPALVYRIYHLKK